MATRTRDMFNTLKGRRMTMKFNLAALAVLAATLAAAPTLASADAITTGTGASLASSNLTAYHGVRHRHRHRRHRRPHMSATTGL
jgi:hypothetical protein